MTGMDASVPEIESAVLNVLAGTNGIVSAYLFGSVAEGRAHRESDVDLGVLLARSAFPTSADRFEARLYLAGRLRALLRRDADVVILNDCPPQLARRILTEGRQIVLHDHEASRAFLRTTLSRAADLEPFLRRMRRIKLAALAR